MIEEEIAFDIFGLDALDDPYSTRGMVKVEYHLFVKTMLAYIWNQCRKSVKRQFERLQTGKALVEEEYESMWPLPGHVFDVIKLD